MARVGAPLRFHKATTNLVRGNVLLGRIGAEPVEYNACDPKLIAMEANVVGDTSPSDARAAAIASAAGVAGGNAAGKP